ncbi:hypothetical protein GURASL_01560 [Geotalea uraniireducens]|uniref:Tetratricopeptide repeat protein n=1 Tax=Geotalea uraniireducens TaxID=351604 RepID=A0ABM8EFQ0_9BACT|nr:tetratricopeptide repeat protein [Geotalea uraniireducens]BDV41233.1 hypothetical protein GURASL_01560 [Geotalea uraniireducens]
MNVVRRTDKGWRLLVAGMMLLCLAPGIAFAAGSGASRLFVTGFTALHDGNSREAAETFDRLLAVYPDTPLRDLALFFLARASLAAGERQQAARAMATLRREYPGSVVVAAAGPELLALAAGYRPSAGVAQVPANGPLARRTERPTGVPDEAGRRHGPAAENTRLAPSRPTAVAANRPQSVIATPVVAAPAPAPADNVPTGPTFELNVTPADAPRPVAVPTLVPLEIVNRGSGADSYRLRAAFPPEFRARFAAAARPGTPIGETSLLAPGQRFAAVLSVVLPPTAIDGQRYVYPLRVASRRAPASDRIRDIVLVAAAPLLRVVVRPGRPVMTPGDRIDYAVTLLNVGSAPAERISLRFRCAGERLAAVAGVTDPAAGDGGEVLTGIRLAPGEIRTGTVSFGLDPARRSGPELRCQAELQDDNRGMAEVFRAAAVRVAAP